MLIFGIDPGFSGAWGAITHNGQYHTVGDMIHDGETLDTEAIWSEMLLARDGQDCEVVLELVHLLFVFEPILLFFYLTTLVNLLQCLVQFHQHTL